MKLMVEPSSSRGRATRERIIAAAADLIHVHGVHGTSIDRVLTAAGAGKGQFYHFFAGKRALVAEVLRLQWERIRVLQEAALQDAHGWAAVEAWFDAIYRIHAVNGFAGGCPIGSIAAEMADDDDAVRRQAAMIFGSQRDSLLDALLALQAAGELPRQTDLVAAADFAIAAIQGGLLLAATQQDGNPLRHALQHTLTHLRNLAL